MASDTLGSDYNLGRLPSKALIENVLGWGWSGSDLTLETLRFRTGSEKQRLSFGITPGIAAFSLESDFTYIQLIPETELSWRSPSSNRFQLSLYPMNCYFYESEYFRTSGFDEPFTMLNSFNWSFLSRKGKIALNTDQYDLSFLYGPQLNSGQFYNHLNFSHTINSDTVPYRMLNISLSPKIGITGRMQICGDVNFRYVDSAISVLNYSSSSSSGNDNYILYRKENTDSFNIGLKLQYRYGNFLTEAGSAFNYWEKIQNGLTYTYDIYNLDNRKTFTDIRYNLSAACVTGNRITKINEIKGNWDRFFSQWLSDGQLLNQFKLEYIPSRKIRSYYSDHGFNEIFDSTSSRFELNQQTKFGVFKYLEIGDFFKFVAEQGVKPHYRLGINIASCNIPLREYGPDSACDQEYFYGIKLRKNQYFLSLIWFIPLFDNKSDYKHIPIFNIETPTGSFKNASNPMINPQKNYPYSSNNINGVSLIDDPDFSLSVAWAPTDKISLSNDLEFKVQNFNYFKWNVNNYFKPCFFSSTTVFSNLFTLIINSSKRTRINLAALYSKQIDKVNESITRNNTNTFAIIFGIQAAFAGNPD